MIKIDFEFETEHGKFADALVLSDDHGLSDVEIEAMKQQRLDNWISFINQSPPDFVTDDQGNLVLGEDGRPLIRE